MIYPDNAQFYWGDGSNRGGARIYASIPYDNGWYHIVGTIENKTWKLYVNGNYQGSLTSSVSFSQGNNNNLYISKEGGYYFNGTIDEVRIYNYARSAEQIKMDYQQGLAAHMK